MADAKLTPGGGITTLSAPGWNVQKWFCDYLPVTKRPKLKLLIHGDEYGSDLYDSLMAAKSKVYMTGLHFMGEFKLKRAAGGKGDESYRLTAVLQTLGSRGVNVFLLVNQFWHKRIEEIIADGIWDPVRNTLITEGGLKYYESDVWYLFRNLLDYKTIHSRGDVHPGVVMSTHHQKTVIIDDKIAYLGGIDLTAVDGDRWDTAGHLIEGDSSKSLRKWDLPENSWHDVHMRVEGDAVSYLIDNFHARWNHGQLYQYDSNNNKKFVQQTEVISLPKVSVTTPLLYLADYQFKKESPPPGIHYRPSNTTGIIPLKTCRASLIQIVRSMPWVTWGKQRPDWNLSGKGWERSAKDAYLIGIRAAEQSIYLENQWISDEDIWAGLAEAAERNKANPDFRIVVVLPYKFLLAAGAGADQDIDISGEIEAVIRASGGLQERFGVFSPVFTGSVPAELDVRMDKEADPVCQVYVHSKIMIVDDCWSLIGSANAGGISLEGVQDDRTGSPDRGASPDSEIAAIVLDRTFATDFRNRLWKEYLGIDSDTSFVDGARLFHQQAPLTTSRIKFNPEYLKKMFTGQQTSPSLNTQIGATALSRLRSDAAIGTSPNLGNVFPLSKAEAAPLDYVFFADHLPAPLKHEAWYKWILRDPYDDPVELTDRDTDEKLGTSYSSCPNAYLDLEAIAAIRNGKETNGWAVQCHVQIRKQGVDPDESSDMDTFLLEYPLTMQL